MADYRYLSYPQFTAKMKDFVILSMIRAKASTLEIENVTRSKSAKIIDLKNFYTEGLTTLASKGVTIKSLHKEKMVARDWAYVYGLH
jgi:hypothetical protein